ncbi:PREDICTED: GTP-binding protein 10-like [Nanorana parkeri]|uniref:GTP-binding protein 10-like n=1 Tax=Nanorana parkeri TaxID=125878 RepID=UPI0008541502|nr:PREDICTED: GTP-binding protein 10-like [Nanorana parkeri]
MDVPGAEEKFQELLKQLENPHDYVHMLPEELVPEQQITFRHILPVSAVSGRGMQELTRCLRRSLEDQAEVEIGESAQEKLRNLHKMRSLRVPDKVQTPS